MSKKITSKMKAVMNPNKHGVTVIDTFFGVHRARPDQNLLLKGDLIKDSYGRVHRFAYQKDGAIFVEPV